MTTAHRATWKAARGGLQEEGSFRLHVPSAGVSAKDAPTERALKVRGDVTTAAASRAELRAALESGERKAGLPGARKRARFVLPDAAPLGLSAEVPAVFGGAAFDEVRALDRDAVLDDGEESAGEEDGGSAVRRLGAEGAENGREGAGGDADEGEESSEEEDSDDDEAELLAELERIRKEREFEKAKKQSEEQERLEREETAKAAAGNPLMPNLSMFNDEISDTASIGTGSVPAFAVKRRWDDDVVFRNQARGERKVTQRFINDTIRNDFHRSFMKKYMR